MISQKAVVYDGITEEKMTINDKKTMLTPIRKINKNFGTLLCHVDLAKKKIMWKYNDNIFWEDLPRWGKRKVIVNLSFDENTKFLLNANVEVQFPGDMTIPQVKAAFLEELIEEKVFQ